MKYRAIIMLNVEISKDFKTIAEAMQWLDSQNNNLEHTTIIEEINTLGETVDWFYYTKE